jgi:hypothetical protein
MSRTLRTAREALGRTRNFATGLLIGASVATPAFAATGITTDEWRTVLLLWSIALLGIGLLLKLRRRRITSFAAATPEPSPQQYRNSIEQYRLQAYH